MSKSKELCKEIQKLEEQKQKLQEKKKQEMIKEGKAFACRKCSKPVVKENASEAELQETLCYDCLQIKRRDEHKKALLDKIKYARIVDVKLDDWKWFTSIERITIYKQGKMYEIKAEEDDGEAYFYIDKEWDEEEPLESYDEEIKPWMKKRAEQPLF